MPLVRVDDHEVRLTHLDKVLWPQSGTTKRELLDYYAAVADTALPYVRGRIATFVRTPDGVEGKRFFQKRPPAGTPEWVTVSGRDRRSGGTMNQIQVNNAATLLWAANGGAIEIHTPQTPAVDPEVADRLVLDLDPGEGATIVHCCQLALMLRERLAEDGLECWAKTSGSKGLHLLAPLEGTSPQAASAYAKELAQDVERRHPELVVSLMTRSRRAGRVFIDWSQNNGAKTTAAPYTVRAQPTPTVSTPLSWDEVRDNRNPQDLCFTIADTSGRIRTHGDLLAPLLDPARARSLPVEPARRGGSRTRSAPAREADHPRGERSASGGRPTPLPRFEPILATAGPLPPAADDDRWAYETKWDGQRVLVELSGDGTIVLRSRKGEAITAAYPELHGLGQALGPGVSAVLDGEIIAPDEHGANSFQRLQSRMGLAGSPAKAARAAREIPARLTVFDVLFLRGDSLVDLPYSARREHLEDLSGLTGPNWSVPTAITGHGEQALQMTRRHRAEGLLCKRLDSVYEPGVRSASWIKIRHLQTVDAVIGGWIPGRGRLSGLPGAVLIGQRADAGTLRYIGRVGTGWSDHERTELAALLKTAAVGSCPFTPAPDVVGARWVLPCLVCEVRYASWTNARRLRQPVWHRLRPDLTTGVAD